MAKRRYTVKRGDTFSSIAKRFGLESSLVANANADVSKLRPGISVEVPVVTTGASNYIPFAKYGIGEVAYKPPALRDTQPPIPPVEQPAKYHPNVYQTALPATTAVEPFATIQPRTKAEGTFNTMFLAPEAAPEFISAWDFVALRNQFPSNEAFQAMVTQMGYVPTTDGWQRQAGVVPPEGGGTGVDYGTQVISSDWKRTPGTTGFAGGQLTRGMPNAYGNLGGSGLMSSWIYGAQETERGQLDRLRSQMFGGGETTTATGGEGGETVGEEYTGVIPPTPEANAPTGEQMVMIQEAGIENYTVPTDPNRSFAGFVRYDGNNIVVHKIDTPGVTEMMVNDYYKTEVAKLAGKPPGELTQGDWDTYGAQVEAFENKYDPYEGMYMIRTSDLPEGFDFESYADKYGIQYFTTGGGYVTQYAPTGFNKVPWSDSDPAYKTWLKDMEEIADEVAAAKYADEQNMAYLKRMEKQARGRAFAPGYTDTRPYGIGSDTGQVRRRSYATNPTPLMWRI